MLTHACQVARARETTLLLRCQSAVIEVAFRKDYLITINYLKHRCLQNSSFYPPTWSGWTHQISSLRCLGKEIQSQNAISPNWCYKLFGATSRQHLAVELYLTRLPNVTLMLYWEFKNVICFWHMLFEWLKYALVITVKQWLWSSPALK